MKFDAQDQTRIATAVSEISRNACRYARGGAVQDRKAVPPVFHRAELDRQLQQLADGAEASEIEHRHDFKFGTNVELVRILTKGEIEIRIFERGVGETRSSGTGSCAAAVAAIASGRAQSPVR